MIPVEWLPLIMFAVLLVFMLTGFPVAFALAANGLLFAFVAIEQGLMSPALLQALPDRIFGIMSNDTLLAIPFFTFMGLVLERSGMAEDLLETIGQLFGRIQGGLAYAVILVGALLAATTGVVAASVISMGLISLPVMLKYGYSKSVSTGVIAASGTLAQILPPSLVLIVMADQLGVSVGAMYQGALVPSLMLVAMFMLYVFAITRLQKSALPALPPEACHTGEDPSDIRLLKSVVFVLLPPLVLVFLVLGTIFLGIATPTEAGAMGATGALLIAASKKRLNLTLLKQALESSTKLSCFVLFILIGSTVFGLTFRAVEGDLWVEHLMGDLPGGEFGFLIAVQILIFVLGFFLDFFEIAFIVIPLLAPVADKLGIDLVWFGVMIAMNMQTSFLTPPFGFSLFYLKSVTPKVIKTIEIYKGALPFIAMQLLMVVLIFLFPNMVIQEKKVVYEDSPLQLEIPAQNYGSDSDQTDNQPFIPQFSQ